MTTRICKICGETKEAVQGVWVLKHGKPTGNVCHACTLEQQRQVRSTEEGRAKSNASRAKSMAKRRKTDAWFVLREKLTNETNRLVHALVNGTSNHDGRFLRLFGHTRAEVLAHITQQLNEKHLNWCDYQVTWQLDHKEPVALAQSDVELRQMFKLANCQVLTMEEHAIKTVVDNARVRSLEA